jgi:hypothetical protein
VRQEFDCGEKDVKYLWLIIPCLIAVAVPFYNTIEPKLSGVPFFFWFQLGLIPVSAFFIFLAYIGDRS